jgi:arylsulfatase A-like enzyme
LERIAEQGTVCETAFATATESAASHGSIFAGQYPSKIRVESDSPQQSLSDDFPLLASWFNKHGYDTYGIAGPAKMSSDYNYDRGFQKHRELYNELPRNNIKEYLTRSVTDPLLFKNLVRTFRKGQDGQTELKIEILQQEINSNLDSPFFALANFTGCHYPYDPPRPWREQATPSLSRPKWFITEYVLEKLGADPVYFDDENIRDERVFNFMDSIHRYFGDSDWLSGTEMDVWRKWYGAYLKYIDYQLGSFLEFLDVTGLRDDTIVVVTSDHGEYFGEHGLMAHGDFLFDENLQVPLILAGPNVPEGERNTDLVSLVDLFDTLCDLCGISSPNTTSGHSLFGAESRDAVVAECGIRDITGFGRAKYMDDEMVEESNKGRKCVRTKNQKLILDSKGSKELYHLPSEDRVNDPDSATINSLLQLMEQKISLEFSQPETDGPELRESVVQNLHDLGYM